MNDRCVDAEGRLSRIARKKVFCSDESLSEWRWETGLWAKMLAAIGVSAFDVVAALFGPDTQVALFFSRVICYFSRVITGPMLRSASTPLPPHGFRMPRRQMAVSPYLGSSLARADRLR